MSEPVRDPPDHTIAMPPIVLSGGDVVTAGPADDTAQIGAAGDRSYRRFQHGELIGRSGCGKSTFLPGRAADGRAVLRAFRESS